MRFYDLNNPKDAKAYILTWVDAGELQMERDSLPMLIETGADEDMLRVAKQLFMFCDPRPAQGSNYGRH